MVYHHSSFFCTSSLYLELGCYTQVYTVSDVEQKTQGKELRFAEWTATLSAARRRTIYDALYKSTHHHHHELQKLCI